MRAANFEAWASTRGGLKENSAASYVDYLEAVERDYALDLDREWKSTALLSAISRLRADRTVNPNTKRNRLSALNKYADFCSSASN